MRCYRLKLLFTNTRKTQKGRFEKKSCLNPEPKKEREKRKHQGVVKTVVSWGKDRVRISLQRGVQYVAGTDRER